MTLNKILALTLLLLVVGIGILLYSGSAILYNQCNSANGLFTQLIDQNFAAHCNSTRIEYKLGFVGAFLGAALFFVALVRINHPSEPVLSVVRRLFFRVSRGRSAIDAQLPDRARVPNWAPVSALVAFVAFSAINTAYYKYNIYLIDEAMGFVGAIPPQQPTAEEIAAAKVVFGNTDMTTITMTLPGEQNWWLGRELVMGAFLGGALFLVSRRTQSRGAPSQ